MAQVEPGGHLLKSVLLVESDGPKAAGYLHALERNGLSVVAMPEGERALDRARAQRPDLVVAASALRDMSGFSLCNRLRRVPGLADLPIVLVSGAGDADAVETHRGSKTPATEYLPPDAPPNDLARCVASVLGLDAQNSDESHPEEPMELEALPEEALAAEAFGDEPERTVLQSLPSIPPLLPSVPPPLPAAGGPPPIRKPGRADPFADLPSEPRLSMGASPEDKVQYFRERLKARDDLIARVRDVHQALRNDHEGAERDLAAARKDLDERERALDQAEHALTQLRAEHARVSHGLDAAQTELSLGAHETATLRQDAEERAQSLSQLLNEAMQQREEENKEWSGKLADGERRLALLQEEVDHLASELEARGQELATVQGGAGDLQAAMEEVRQRAQEDSAALAEKLEQLQGENAALSSDLGAQRASLEIKEADLTAEIARSQTTSNAVTEAQAAVQAVRDEWQAERQSWQAERQFWEEKQSEAQAVQQSLEERIAEADARQAELRGELEAVQEAEQQTAGTESRLVELEAELSSRVDEVNGLRTELETLGQERAQEEADSAARLADLSAQLDAKEAELQQALSARADEEARVTEQEARAAEALEESQRIEARAHSAEVELSRVEGRARAAEAEAAEAEGRAREGAGRIAQLEASLQEAEDRAEAAQGALAKAAQPHPSSGSNPPAGGDKSLRVRISDLTLELQTLRTKLAQAQGSGLSAEVARLRDELEAQRAENDFLTGELDRLQGGR